MLTRLHTFNLKHKDLITKGIPFYICITFVYQGQLNESLKCAFYAVFWFNWKPCYYCYILSLLALLLHILSICHRPKRTDSR